MSAISSSKRWLWITTRKLSTHFPCEPLPILDFAGCRRSRLSESDCRVRNILTLPSQLPTNKAVRKLTDIGCGIGPELGNHIIDDGDLVTPEERQIWLTERDQLLLCVAVEVSLRPDAETLTLHPFKNRKGSLRCRAIGKLMVVLLGDGVAQLLEGRKIRLEEDLVDLGSATPRVALGLSCYIQ